MGRSHSEFRRGLRGSHEGCQIFAGSHAEACPTDHRDEMNLLELQRRMAGAIMAPLGPADRLARSAGAEAASIIKPNDRLTSGERLEIYAKSYWYRILDSLYDDFPGLRAILGVRAFDKMSRAYLAEMPSESFTLRDLGSRLP